MPDALSLHVRDASDYAQQLHVHRLTALARALHQSTLVQPLRSPQNVPYASPRTQAAGSPEAARLEAQKEELKTRHWRLVEARRVGSVADIVSADRRITELEEQIARTVRELAAIDTSRSAPAGIIHLYSIMVPALSVSGYLEAVYAPEGWVLDTHSLSRELRERLDAYLLGGRDALPYWYKRTRQRYWASTDAPVETRQLMIDLWKYAMRAEATSAGQGQGRDSGVAPG